MLSGMLDTWVSCSEKKTRLDYKSRLGAVFGKNGFSLFLVTEMGAKHTRFSRFSCRTRRHCLHCHWVFLRSRQIVFCCVFTFNLIFNFPLGFIWDRVSHCSSCYASHDLLWSPGWEWANSYSPTSSPFLVEFIDVLGTIMCVFLIHYS